MAETFLLFKEPQLSSESVIEERNAVSDVFKKFKETTHSPMVAPIGAYTAASLIPDNNEGIAAGIFK